MAGLYFCKEMSFSYGELVEVAPGLRRLIVENPSHFTFHGTGVYVVGTGQVAVIDPGPIQPSSVDPLLKALGSERVSAILVTHTHLDHSPAAALLADATGAETYGFGPHARTTNKDTVEEGADFNFEPDNCLTDGQIVSGENWTLEAVHTPGHTSNHLCYAFREENTLLSGDHVMGWSTTVVSPPDGDMADYMASLKKLLSRPEKTYWPTHGPSIPDAHSFVEGLYRHREDRERQIIAFLENGPASINQMVPAMYTDIPTALYPAAARSVFAHLLKMVNEGRIVGNADPCTALSVFQLRAL